MNGLSSISSWGGEQKPVLAYVYGAIDSKIDFVELNTRKLLAKFSRKETPQVQGMHRTDAVQNLPSSADLNVINNENDTFFTHLEELSRTITMLENMKFSLREHNATRTHGSRSSGAPGRLSGFLQFPPAGHLVSQSPRRHAQFRCGFGLVAAESLDA